MGFLNPGLLGLLGLGAVPVVIHLLNRRRYQVVRWPAMQFLLRAQVKTRQRLRMENLLLLLVRTLAVLLFALAAARPFLPSAEALAALGPDRRHLYVLLDNSASMGYQEGISPLLRRAVEEAERAVDNAIRSDDPVTLVVACDPRHGGRPRALLRGERNHAKVREALYGRVALTDARMDPAACLSEVAAVADPSDPRRSLLVLSDFQRTDWAPVEKGEDPSGAGGAAAAIRTQLDRLEEKRFDLGESFRSLGSPEPEDLAVLSLGPADGRAPVEGVPAAFDVAVGNNGPAPVTAEVRFLVDGREQASQRVSLRGRPSRSPAPEPARVSFRWAGTAGSHVATAEIAGPGNRWSPDKDHASNDRRSHAFEVRERVRVLLVDGDPSPRDGSFPETRLLEVALSLRRGVVPAETTVIPATDLPRERFEGRDVVVLANVDRFPEGTLERLAGFVRRGGGLLVFLGDAVDPVAWNSCFRRPGCEGVLPARLAATPRVDPSAPFALDLTASDHPALRDLTDPRAGTSFEPPLVAGWWPVQPTDEATEVLLRLRDLPRSPYLLERRSGRGRTLLVTSSADLDWTGPSLLFAPLLQELVSYLASSGGDRLDVAVHEPLVCEVPGTAREISVEVPGGQVTRDLEAVRREEDGEPGGEALVVRFLDTAAAGPYRVRWKAPPERGGLGGAMLPGSRAFAVNLDPREADTARMRRESLGDRFQRPDLVPGAGTDADGTSRERRKEAPRGELTGAAVGLGLLLVLGEMFLAAAFGRRRR